MAQDPGLKTILVVDDDETVATFFEMLLIKEGFQVAVSQSGQAALTRLKKGGRAFDLIVLDLMMPAPGGYEVLKELQRLDYQKVPIFIITARTLDSGTIAMLKLESNVKEFWKKPIDPADFKKKVHEYLDTTPKS